MNALRRFLLAVKGVRVIPPRDDEERLEGPGIGRGLYERDADFIINEARLRLHDDLTMANPKTKPRKLRVITTSNMDGQEAEGPTIQSLTEPESKPMPKRKPDKLNLRKRWRKLKEELNELEQK